MDDNEVNDNEECFAYFNCTKEPNALNEGKVELEFQYCERKNSCLVGNGTYSESVWGWRWELLPLGDKPRLEVGGPVNLC